MQLQLKGRKKTPLQNSGAGVLTKFKNEDSIRQPPMGFQQHKLERDHFEWI